MKAVVYHGEQDVRVEEVPEPELLAPDDAIVRVRRASICGSDLHFYHGRIPGIFPGAVVGHEFAGEVVAVGDEVSAFAPGDPVVGSFQAACGTCEACRGGRFNHCDDLAVYGYGIFLGDLAGSQAELVRVPHADVNLLRVPGGVTLDQALFTGDIMATGWYAAGIAEIQPGADVVVLGAGPVGLFTQMAARAMGAGRIAVIDLVPARLELAEKLGGIPVNSAQQSPSVAIDDLFGHGADVVIETVGLMPALTTAIDCVRAGGMISVIGVHSEFEYPLPLANVFTRNITLRFGGPCNVQGWWHDALAAVQDGTADPLSIVSHRMPLDAAAEGYRLFDRKEATKVLLELD